MNDDTLLGIVFGSICGCGLFGAIGFLVIGTIFKLPFGINIGGADCAECGEKAPIVRAPNDLYEVLWGGWTCQNCGCRNDKWGRSRDGERRRRKKRRDDDEED